MAENRSLNDDFPYHIIDDTKPLAIPMPIQTPNRTKAANKDDYYVVKITYALIIFTLSLLTIIGNLYKTAHNQDVDLIVHLIAFCSVFIIELIHK
jgi:hypothetical protein